MSGESFADDGVSWHICDQWGIRHHRECNHIDSISDVFGEAVGSKNKEWFRQSAIGKRWIGLLSGNNWSFILSLLKQITWCSRGECAACIPLMEPIELKMMKVYPPFRWTLMGSVMTNQSPPWRHIDRQSHPNLFIDVENTWHLLDGFTFGSQLLSQIEIKHFILLSNWFPINL